MILLNSCEAACYNFKYNNCFYLLVVYKLVFLVSRSDSRNRSFLYHLFFAGGRMVDDEKAWLLYFVLPFNVGSIIYIYYIYIIDPTFI